MPSDIIKSQEIRTRKCRVRASFWPVWVTVWVNCKWTANFAKLRHFSEDLWRQKVKKNRLISCEIRRFCGCEGRPWTYDLRVMSCRRFLHPLQLSAFWAFGGWNGLESEGCTFSLHENFRRSGSWVELDTPAAKTSFGHSNYEIALVFVRIS